MALNSPIEWTEATWNPIRGCTRVSPGCGGPGPQGGCYAERVAARFSGPGKPYAGLAELRGGKARWTGKLAFAESVLPLPLNRRKPTMWFVNSMSDLFHEQVPDEWVDRIFAVMALCPQHTFQMLTKRSARMRAYLSAGWQTRIIDHMRGLDPEHRPGRGVLLRTTNGVLPNVWAGVSAEDQQRADERVPDLLATPAAIRWVSAEPLLDSIDFRRIAADDTGEIDALGGLSFCQGRNEPARLPRLDWVVTGGESGPRARAANPQWFRDIRDQCHESRVAFLHKQNGEWVSVSEVEGPGEIFTFPDGRNVRRVGKKKAGRTIDGVTYDEMPEVRA